MRAVLLSLFAFCAFGQTWTVQKPDLATILIGVSFPTTSEGFLAGDENGIGTVILRTDDGGNSYKRCNQSGFSMMYLSCAFGSATNGVVSGVGIGKNIHGIEETVDGWNFNWTDTMELIDASQNAEAVKGVPGGFGLAGDFNNANGVTVTLDKGQTWNNYDIGLDYEARYASYPSATTWYVSAGIWPEEDFHTPSDRNIHVLSQHMRLHKGVGVEWHRDFPSNPSSRKLLQTSYCAGIAKTADGGKTWTKVFEDLGNFYFNGIDCPSEDHCWVVGESESDSPQPGARILHTGDGGQTWEVQMYVDNPTYSLLDIAFVSETEGWATGGILTEKFQGTYWHTTDAGQTWTPSEVDGVYGNALSFAMNADNVTYVGWSTAFTRSGQSSVLVYK